MIHDSLAYRTARNHVTNYAGEVDQLELMVFHQHAMECRDCESYLQLGIDAFEWIGRADSQNRKDIFAGDREYDPATDEALHLLYRLWLKPCDFAEKWIAVQVSREFEVENLERFRECCKEAKAIVDHFNGGGELSPAMQDLRDRAIEEHRNGQTAEFV